MTSFLQVDFIPELRFEPPIVALTPVFFVFSNIRDRLGLTHAEEILDDQFGAFIADVFAGSRGVGDCPISASEFPD
ncbi:MAG TPA: hypothetical protein EYG38_07135 [Verrucomicrobia bacterium]|nr:hypothetical protein [Verrucomicrobiota bacterium]